MNVYTFIKIGGRIVEISGLPTVSVHGAENAAEVEKMAEQGISMKEIKKQFCGYCCGKLPCGCSNPYPQG